MLMAKKLDCDTEDGVGAQETACRHKCIGKYGNMEERIASRIRGGWEDEIHDYM